MIVGFSLMPIVVGFYTLSKPNSNAVYTNTQMFVYFIIPMSLFSLVFLTLIVAVAQWSSHKTHLVPQEMSFSEETVRQVSQDGTVEMPWSNFYTFYKETRRSFFLWQQGGPHWTMIPKRSFASGEQLSKYRALLASKLRQSYWFFG